MHYREKAGEVQPNSKTSEAEEPAHSKVSAAEVQPEEEEQENVLDS